ncbi:MAG: DNA polymerase III subunit delta' [Bacteroidetes bacterium]|nr:DNA polymerase III subunit delta' [Bacteroidota bacterium]
MAWNSIIGQERVKRLLIKTLEQRTIAHAYLFYGPKGIGKSALALEFAKALLCEAQSNDACGSCKSCKQFETLQHPDVHLVFPLPIGNNEKSGDDPYERLTDEQLSTIREQLRLKARNYYHTIEIPKANFIKINSIRELKKQTALARIQSRFKVFVIFEAEKMNTEAANSLLKTLEEPLPNTVLLLTTNDRDQILTTIISRCQQVQCMPLSEDEIIKALIERDGCSESHARSAARLSNGSYWQAQRIIANDIEPYQTEVINFLGYAVTRQWRELIAIVDELVTREKYDIRQWLQLLQLWLREAMVLRETKIDNYSFFHAERCKRFLERYPNARLNEAITAIDRAIAHLDKNVYLPLVITTLALDLHQLITDYQL